jgi:hypothetical protein
MLPQLNSPSVPVKLTLYFTGPRWRDLRHNTGGQVRFTTVPFMTGFLSEPEDLRAGGRFAPTRRFTWIVGMFFLIPLAAGAVI